MKRLEKYAQKIEDLDVQIVRLFEQRMCTVKKITEYRATHDLLPKEKKTNFHEAVVRKATEAACDTEVIEYTEGLIMYMMTVAKKFSRKITRYRR